MLKNNKGITLIALIITLVVLIILTAVGIKAAQGNKLIDKTENVLYDYEDLQIAEKIKLEYLKLKELGNIEPLDLIGKIKGNDWCKVAALSNNKNSIYIESKRGRFYKLDLSNGSVSTNINNENINTDTTQYKLTIKASNAYITIKSTNNTACGNDIGEGVTLNDYANSSITYTISRDGYISQTNTIILTEDKTLYINLDIKTYNVKISSEDSEAMIIIYNSVGNELKKGNGLQETIVNHGDTISYKVSKDGYNDNVGTIKNITKNEERSNLKITKKQYKIVFNVHDINGNVISDTVNKINGIVVTDSIPVTVEHGTKISYSVEKDGYTTVAVQDVEIISADPINVTIGKPCTITVNPKLNDKTNGSDEIAVKITKDNGEVLLDGKGNVKITVDFGTKIKWEVSKAHYTSNENNKGKGSATITSDLTIDACIERTRITYTKEETYNEWKMELRKNKTYEFNNTFTYELENEIKDKLGNGEGVIMKATFSCELYVENSALNCKHDITCTFNGSSVKNDGKTYKNIKIINEVTGYTTNYTINLTVNLNQLVKTSQTNGYVRNMKLVINIDYPEI
jgi:hypothetical protein